MKKEKTKATNLHQKPLQELTLLDRFLFREAMEIPIVNQNMLSILLGKSIELAERPETEKELGISPQMHSIRLDVFSEDVDKRLYSIEMQRRNTGNLRKRSRFYQSQIDVTLLEPGKVDYNELNDTYLIMICPFDLFGKNAYRYTFYPVCAEFPDIRLEDGSCRMFINTRGLNHKDFDEEFLQLMDYLNAPAKEAEQYVTTEKIRQIHGEIVKLKQREEFGVKYMMEWEERIYDRMEAQIEGRAEGRAQGREEGRITATVDFVRNAVEKLGISLEKACGIANITMETYDEYVELYDDAKLS